jgi:hypothetical protein
MASLFAAKSSALKMISRETCRHCKRDYRSVEGNVGIYKNAEGKWCSRCSCCGIEQAYTRKDHAKQSELCDWQCKQCIAIAKGFSENMPVGNGRRFYNRFRKSANRRNIQWDIDYEEFMQAFTGKCALSGWDISMAYANSTASLDRIDSSKGYSAENIQWVHVIVNMCKNKYPQEQFIAMCKAISDLANR